MDGPSQAAASQRSPRQVILGLFILGQLAFLVLANALGFFQGPREELPAEVAPIVERVLPGYANRSSQMWTGPDELAAALTHWSELTGQPQSWSLFAPGVYTVTGFPALVLVDTDDADAELVRTFDLMNRHAPGAPARDGLQILRSVELEPPAVRAATRLVMPLAAHSPFDGAVLAAVHGEPGVTVTPLDVDVFLSDNEPADVQHFARLGRFRLRRFESILIPYLSQRDDETLAAARVRWADAIRDHVGRYADAMFFYLQWRLEAYRARHPDRPDPAQVMLVERTFAIVPPGDAASERWHGPRTTPIARWRPHAPVPQDCRPIERYNPANACFENVAK